MAYTSSVTAVNTLLATVGQLNSIVGTLEVKLAGTPATVADIDAEYVGILNGYNSQITKIYDELKRLSSNLITG